LLFRRSTKFIQVNKSKTKKNEREKKYKNTIFMDGAASIILGNLEPLARHLTAVETWRFCVDGVINACNQKQGT